MPAVARSTRRPGAQRPQHRVLHPEGREAPGGLRASPAATPGEAGLGSRSESTPTGCGTPAPSSWPTRARDDKWVGMAAAAVLLYEAIIRYEAISAVDKAALHPR